jgi:exodeoxyribonuclease-3
MKIFSWNVNGLRSLIKKGEFTRFVDNFQPDIFCLQETKAKRGQVEIDLPDYQEFWNSAERAGYSGTAIFVKKSKPAPAATSQTGKAKPAKTGENPPYKNTDIVNAFYDLPASLANRYHLYDDKFGDPNHEGRVLALELQKFFLVTVYTPNSKEDLSRLNLRANLWDPAFRDYVTELSRKKPVIFCGDLNVAHTEIDLARPAENQGKHGFTKEERMGLSSLISSGFIDTFRSLHPDEKDAYTWWSNWANSRQRNVGWRIDYFLASTKLAGRITAAAIYPQQMGSDHCPISITLEE